MATETEGVVDDGIDLDLARSVRNVIQIAERIGIFEIDRWRNDFGLNRLCANGHFDGAGRAEHVAGGALGGADGESSARGRRRQF